MYDYEYHSNEVCFLFAFHLVVSMKHWVLVETGRIYIPELDGMFCVASSAFEEEAIKTWNRWFESIGRVHYPIGPLSVSKAGLHGGDGHKEDGTHGPVVDFLDRMQAKFGGKSVIYISFGSMWWPKEASRVWTMAEEFLRSNTPIILAHPGLQNEADKEKLSLLRDSPIAIELEWAPQETILSHPATGWFVAHGGWNGTQEALRYRVPQIFWPFGGDQSYNSAVMTRVHKAGFQLFNIRSDEVGKRTPYVFDLKEVSDQPTLTFTLEALRQEVRDLLVKLKGEEGAIVRKNLGRLADGYLKGWDENGEARRNTEDFLRKFVDSDLASGITGKFK
ncbi:UDP-Glycosyltransferase/glycogen phosphorylase [Dendrothele bispora CBS 962.96]|uniref:UDP-Glycosyltransferase/glycogen phosphorylase n=1 Tax=Dendrothele bispora (strain CBS 962.96) TaxID=1314807 RepID=A0A4S8MW45_DENBC|nr:UDP-Glycosyltransferase/glycogen phosphorylase [Dendrothele bispora CBS 962.96]